MAEIIPNKPINEVVNEVMNILNLINKAKISSIGGNKLTEIAIRLAQYKAYLGGEVAELDYNLKMMEEYRDDAWADAYAGAKQAEDKVTDTAARTIADQSTSVSKKEEIELGRKYNKIKNLRQDIGDLITTVQSRVGHLKSEKIDSFMPNPN